MANNIDNSRNTTTGAEPVAETGAAAGIPQGAARTRYKTAWLAKMGILLAITVVFSFIPNFPLMPGVDFIRYEFSDLPILIGAFAFGTPAGIVLGALSIVLNFLIGGAESGPYGMLMHFIAIGAYALTAGLIYNRRKDRRHAIVGMLCGVVAMTLVMVPANLVITPLFMGVPVDAVRALLLPAIVPANFLKGLLTAVLTFLLYKRVSPFLHRW